GTPGQPAAPGAPYPAPGQPGIPGAAGAAPAASVTCELEAQPKVGNVNGQLRDAETSSAVGGAAVKITDKLGRSLSLTADAAGAPEYNLRLSSERANAVREALIRDGVEPNRLTARGYGQEKPLVPNTNDANRAKNRRVQLMIQK